jgi:hypothetical protein
MIALLIVILIGVLLCATASYGIAWIAEEMDSMVDRQPKRNSTMVHRIRDIDMIAARLNNAIHKLRCGIQQIEFALQKKPIDPGSKTMEKLSNDKSILEYIVKKGHCGGISCTGIEEDDPTDYGIVNEAICPLYENCPLVDFGDHSSIIPIAKQKLMENLVNDKSIQSILTTSRKKDVVLMLRDCGISARLPEELLEAQTCLALIKCKGDCGQFLGYNNCSTCPGSPIGVDKICTETDWASSNYGEDLVAVSSAMEWLTDKLAEQFLLLIRRDVAARDCETIDRRNALEDKCCATHDFLDANMTMCEAFKSVIDMEDDAASQVDTDIINKAWDKAKKTGFTVPVLPESRKDVYYELVADQLEPFICQAWGICKLYYADSGSISVEDCPGSPTLGDTMIEAMVSTIELKTDLLGTDLAWGVNEESLAALAILHDVYVKVSPCESI